MKKFLNISLIVFAGLFSVSAQKIDSTSNIKKDELADMGKISPLTKKGQMFVFWGWNRAGFTNSDIRFKGNGYDFTLENVVAHDRPSPLSLDYINPGKVSIPQFNFRLGYFIKDNIALVVGTDHMKYVMDQDQTVKLNGHISDPVYAAMVKNGEVNLADEQFLTFEHTDGLNYVNAGLEKYKNIYSRKNVDIVWAYGGGLGVMFPKSNVKLFGNERSDRFHVAGFGTDLRTNINFVFWNNWMARVEAKAGYINMFDIKTTLNNKPDKAIQDFFFGQVNFGIGYTFSTGKNR